MKRRHGVGHAAAGAGPIIIRSGLRLTGKLIGAVPRETRAAAWPYICAARAGDLHMPSTEYSVQYSRSYTKTEVL
jgi:hypothetical protein